MNCAQKLELTVVELDRSIERTGESHDLFPGDTVVLTDAGYVIHKFSE